MARNRDCFWPEHNAPRARHFGPHRRTISGKSFHHLTEYLAGD